ncbi:MAG: sensor histidine kinase [Burkholderiales bacterium]|nr:MAG: sensor histidine kinase [Burkholderiales bacterium]
MATLRALLLALAAAAALIISFPASATTLRSVEWTLTEIGAAPADDAQWQAYDLPLRWSARPGEETPRGLALRLRATLEAPPSVAWAVLLSYASTGGRVSVNGRMVGEIRADDARTHVRWRRPHLLAIDPALLVAGENSILLQTAYRGGVHGLAGVEIGPLAELSRDYELRYFASTILPWIGGTLAACFTLLFTLLWLRRHDPTIALVALASAFWVLRSAYFLIETVPVAAAMWLDLLFYVASGGFAVVMTLVLLRLAGRTGARAAWLPVLYAAIGPALLLVTGGQATSHLDRLWLPGLIGVVAIGLLYALLSRVRKHESLQIVVITAITVAIAAAVYDYGVAQGWLPEATVLALHWAGPLLLAALATPVVDRFVRVLREAEGARNDLESRVREREQMLKRNYERLREGERIQATAAERQRIMQDMHDGLGTQLVSSLMLVERGALTQAQVAQVLRESIDDMRLAIDALAQGSSDLLASLGNLRYRMEPRFRAAGIELIWDARDMPEELNINPDAVLPILRIVQESLTNALKHSGARAVSVALQVTQTGEEAPLLQIRVTDNGKGIAGERVGGRGLMNMRSRANKIGGTLTLESVPGAGTRVKFTYQLTEYHTGLTRSPTQLGLNTEAIIERFREGNG